MPLQCHLLPIAKAGFCIFPHSTIPGIFVVLTGSRKSIILDRNSITRTATHDRAMNVVIPLQNNVSIYEKKYYLESGQLVASRISNLPTLYSCPTAF